MRLFSTYIFISDDPIMPYIYRHKYSTAKQIMGKYEFFQLHKDS